MRSTIVCLIFVCLSGTDGESEIRVPETNEFPFQVSVWDFRKKIHLCSGVLITRSFVLSLASCIPEDEIVKVTSGSIYLSKQTEAINSASIQCHEKYNPNFSGYNIAIIELGDPFTLNEFTQLARIPVSEFPLVNVTKLSGWNWKMHDRLLVFDGISVWKRECREKFNLTREPSFDEFCANYKIGNDITLFSPGSIISKNCVVFGLQVQGRPKLHLQIFTQISEHAEWIKDKLGDRSKEIKWYGENSAAGSRSICIAVSLMLVFFTSR